MKTTFHFSMFLLAQVLSVPLLLAATTTISPNQIVEKNFLVYREGSSEPYTGLVVSARYDGSKEYEEHYLDGQLHGPRTDWDRGGNQISQTTYVHGAKTGPETHWYANGQVMAVTNYANGARHGTASRWCKNGQKRFEWTYANNQKNGTQAAWYPNGQEQSRMVFKDDRPRGRLTRWYENGQLWSDTRGDPDRKIVTSTSWYETGQKRCEAIIAKGEPPARSAWDENGNVLELNEEQYFAHCNSWLGPASPKTGERIVSIRVTPNEATRYATVGTKTTETEIEVSAAEREKVRARGQAAAECGLPREMAF